MVSINANKLSRHDLMGIVSQIAEAAEYDYEDIYWVDLSDGYYFGGYTEVVEHYTFDTTIVFHGSMLTTSGWLKSYDGGKTFEFDSIDDIEVVSGDCHLLEDYEYDYDRLGSDLDGAFYEYYKSKTQNVKQAI